MDKSTSWTTKKMDVSLAKSFVFYGMFLLGSLIYIKKKGGSKMKAFGTPEIIDKHREDWLLTNTQWYVTQKAL